MNAGTIEKVMQLKFLVARLPLSFVVDSSWVPRLNFAELVEGVR